MRTLSSFLAACLLLAAPALAQAATFKVSNGESIQDVLDEEDIQPGDVIVVGPGTYGPFVINGETNLTVKAQGDVVIDAGGNWAIDISQSTDVTVSGFRIVNSDVGVVIQQCTGATASGITVTESESEAIQVRDSTDSTITRCTLVEPGGEGVWEDNTTGTIITKNTIDNPNASGLFLSGSTGNHLTDGVISKNRIVGAQGFGIYVAARNSVIEKNVVDGATIHGIQTGSSTDTTGCIFQKNTISNSGNDSISFPNGNQCQILKNKITGGDWGVRVWSSCNDVTVEKNKVTGIDGIGIHADGSNTMVLKNTLKDIGDIGIVVSGSGQMVIANKVTNTENNGIDTDDNGFHTLEKNKVTNAGEDGIEVNDGDCILTKNKVKNSGRHGIRLNSDGNNLTGNKASGSGKTDNEGVDFWTDDRDLTESKNKFKTTFDNNDV